MIFNLLQCILKKLKVKIIYDETLLSCNFPNCLFLAVVYHKKYKVCPSKIMTDWIMPRHNK